MENSSETLGKRKRTARVSYLEPEYDFDEDDVADEDHIKAEAAFYNGELDNSDDEDVTYSTRKRSNKIQGRPKKKMRLTAPKRPKREPEKHFRFLDLPAELRDMIYEMALVEPAGLTLVNKTRANRRTVVRRKIDQEGGGRRNVRRWGWGGSRRIPNTNAESAEQENPQLVPRLLAVNKQIHDEAVGYLYKQPIILEDTMALHAFLAIIGPSNRLVLSDLTIRSWGSSRGSHKVMNHTSLTLLAGCTNLKSLFLDGEIGWRRSPENLAKTIYRDGYHFLEAFGTANGHKHAALDVLSFKESNYGWQYRGYGRVVEDDPEKCKQAFVKELKRLLR